MQSVFTIGHVSLASLGTLIVSGLAKLGWNAVKHDRKLLADIHTELTTQRTNCLTTLQAQGTKQIEVLEAIDKNLVEQNGYIKGWLDRSHDA